MTEANSPEFEIALRKWAAAKLVNVAWTDIEKVKIASEEAWWYSTLTGGDAASCRVVAHVRTNIGTVEREIVDLLGDANGWDFGALINGILLIKVTTGELDVWRHRESRA